MKQKENTDVVGYGSDLSPTALNEALQDLRLHKFELEMQNDELRRTLIELDTAQVRYFDFYDLAPVGYITISDKAVILQANLSTAALLGWTRDHLIGKVFTSFMCPNDADSYYLLCKRTLASASAQSLELQVRKADGNVIWANLHAIAAISSKGAVVFRLVMSDVTDRKKAEAELLENTTLTDAILNSVQSQIAVLDQTGRIVSVNQAWRKFALNNAIIAGQSASRTGIGTNYLDVCRAAKGGDSQEAMLAFDGIVSVLKGTVPVFSLEYPCHSPEQQRWFFMTVTPLQMENYGVVINHVDITHRRQLEQAAKQASEVKFQLVADNVFDGIVIFDAEGQIEYVSTAYAQQLGYSGAEELRQSLTTVIERIHPQDRDLFAAGSQRAIELNESHYLHTYRIRHRLGHYLWRESSAKFQYDEYGKLIRTCVVARDITERKIAEIDLRIAAVAFDSQLATAIFDDAGVIVRVNRAFAESTGYSAAEAVGQTLQILQSDQHDDDFYLQVWDCARRTGNWQGEIWDRHKDGSVVPKSVTISSVKGIDGVVSHYVGCAFDLSEQKHAETTMLEMNRSLTQSQKQLRQLVAVNETRLEKEKQHIAREVHDELGQVLTTLRMDLSLATMRYANQAPQLLDDLNGMKILVDRAIQSVRSVATGLRPAALDMGLVTAIKWLSREFAQRGGVACDLITSPGIDDMDASRAIVVFRIVQESLTNISRYASASKVTVSLARQCQELHLEVCDNGIGFDVEAAAQRGSLGLLGIRERVMALGGRVEINSQRYQGTTIAAVIPLASEFVEQSI